MFPELPAAKFGKDEASQAANLTRLADAMISDFDGPKDGPDDEESGIPALYTYFGQFVDHDLTFDPDGSFQKQKDPNATEDFRSPAFDLDNVYGRGPGDQPYLYSDDGRNFLLGDPLTLGNPPGAVALQIPRAGRALIGDPRNDENAIVSQLQGLFLRFHNRLSDENPAKPFGDSETRPLPLSVRSCERFSPADRFARRTRFIEDQWRIRSPEDPVLPRGGTILHAGRILDCRIPAGPFDGAAGLPPQ
jgi:hypothetical protein